MTQIIRKRPVRFYLLLNSILAMVMGFGLQLTMEQFGLIMGVINAGLAFFIENYTTPVDEDNRPLNPDYVLAPKGIKGSQ